MKARAQFGTKRAPEGAKDVINMDIVCYKCSIRGHVARACPRKQWCTHCKSHMHNNAGYRWKKQRDNAWKASEESRCDADVPDIKRKGLMVNAGTASHIITKFKRFDNSFFGWSWHKVSCLGKMIDNR